MLNWSLWQLTSHFLFSFLIQIVIWLYQHVFSSEISVQFAVSMMKIRPGKAKLTGTGVCIARGFIELMDAIPAMLGWLQWDEPCLCSLHGRSSRQVNVSANDWSLPARVSNVSYHTEKPPSLQPVYLIRRKLKKIVKNTNIGIREKTELILSKPARAILL